MLGGYGFAPFRCGVCSINAVSSICLGGNRRSGVNAQGANLGTLCALLFPAPELVELLPVTVPLLLVVWVLTVIQAATSSFFLRSTLLLLFKQLHLLRGGLLAMQAVDGTSFIVGAAVLAVPRSSIRLLAVAPIVQRPVCSFRLSRPARDACCALLEIDGSAAWLGALPILGVVSVGLEQAHHCVCAVTPSKVPMATESVKRGNASLMG